MQVLKYTEDTLNTISQVQDKELSEVAKNFEMANNLEMEIYAVLDFDLDGQVGITKPKRAVYLSEYLLHTLFEFVEPESETEFTTVVRKP